MVFALKIYDETPGAPRRLSRELRLVRETVTLRKILQRRIDEEAAEINNGGGLAKALVSPIEQQLNPERRRKPVDPAAQLAAAIEAFERTRIVVIVDDRQVMDIDAPLTLTPESTVTFLKLVPLVGG